MPLKAELAAMKDEVGSSRSAWCPTPPLSYVSVIFLPSIPRPPGLTQASLQSLGHTDRAYLAAWTWLEYSSRRAGNMRCSSQQRKGRAQGESGPESECPASLQAGYLQDMIDTVLMLTILWRLQLRSVRGQLASSASACATAEARNRQLSGQVSGKIAELAQMGRGG